MSVDIGSFYMLVSRFFYVKIEQNSFIITKKLKKCP